MNKTEIAKLLTIASGFDRRVVDELTVEAWASVPELAAAEFEAAKTAVIAHQTGPKRGEYLTVGHVVDAVRVMQRRSVEAVEADVRSAKARRLIDASWPARDPLPVEVAEALATARASERPLLEVGS